MREDLLSEAFNTQGRTAPNEKLTTSNDRYDTSYNGQTADKDMDFGVVREDLDASIGISPMPLKVNPIANSTVVDNRFVVDMNSSDVHVMQS